nr:uncharacterized mitochondrial protein AtMg00810-like [Tanacetum cinerariifolium]
VLVTKPHNKTPYELLLGRTPSIGFMRPFGCLVTILKTLDPLGKFDGKDDEGFLLGYSVSSKAFRVFNRKVGKEPVSTPQYVLLPLWSTSSKDPHNIDADAAFADKEYESEVHVSSSSSDKPKKHDDKANREVQGKNHVDVSTGVRDLSDEFEEFSVNSTNRVNAVSTRVTTVGPNSTNITNSFNVVGPSNTVVSPNFEIGEKSSFVDPSQYPDDPDMHALEDITYSNDEEDVGAEADFPNLETNILVSPILTTRVHKHQLVIQIIGDLSSAPQTKIMARMVKAQVKKKPYGIFISQDKYVAEILRKFGLTDGKSASTPINTKKPLLKDPDGEDVDVHTYRSMIGSLMYLTSSRPDIMYLKGKPHLGLWYPKDSPFNLVAYSNSDYVRASLDRKSTTGGCQFLGCRFISWQCKKQTVIATSSTEAKYIAAVSCCAQVLGIQNQLLDYRHIFNAVRSKLLLFGLMVDAAHLLLLEDEDDVNEVSDEPTPPSPTPATPPPPPQKEHIPSPP